MTNRKKYIYKTYLRDVNKYQYDFFEDKENNCYISVKNILEIKNPFYTEQGGCLIDNNYYIVEVVPLDENYCIRIFIDNKKQIILYYFDITKKNGFDKEINSPYYYDLYLDVVLKDGEIRVLDEDELENALKERNINKSEYNLAINKKNELIKTLENNTNRFMRFNFIKYLNNPGNLHFM